MRRKPEETLQRAVVAFLDVALPADAVWWHIPNGGGRSKAEAERLKAAGCQYFVARSVEAVAFALLANGIPSRAALSGMGAPEKEKGRSRVNEIGQSAAT